MDDISQITLKQLRYFIAIADQGSFRRAADRLGITQPALTTQIAALEKSLDVKLFERARSGSSLSISGRELTNPARRVLEETRAFCTLATSLSGDASGTYRLGVTPTLGPYLLPVLLPVLHAEYQEMKLYVQEGAPRDLEEGLKRSQHDLILTTEPVTSKELSVAPLFREPLVLAIGKEHRLAGRRRINRSDLLGEEILTLGEHHLFHRQILELCERIGATVRRDFEGTSLDTLRHMVVMNNGLAFLPTLYVRSEIRNRDELRIAEVQGARVFRNHALVWRPTSPARQLYRELAKRIRGIVSDELHGEVIPAR